MFSHHCQIYKDHLSINQVIIITISLIFIKLYLHNFSYPHLVKYTYFNLSTIIIIYHLIIIYYLFSQNWSHYYINQPKLIVIAIQTRFAELSSQCQPEGLLKYTKIIAQGY